ncbi:MAG: type II secretion system F family protein [Patescibacteria group bacterium]|nr:type II secretion system F family protein [Patescibacteria group bacterium]MDE2590480.1 type II secretion system F family protein [Patescibacteria group bacterium]
MKLTYKATSRDGKIQSGEIEAKDIPEAVFYLRNKELVPIQVKPKSEEVSFPLLSLFKKQSANDLVLFTRQLSSILSSGLTLMQALTILKDQTQNQIMKDITAGIITDVQEGKTLAMAIAKYPSIFSPIYISLIRAGESSGFLDKILERLADNLEKSQKLKSTIKSALLYPVIIVILMVVVMTIMMIFVIPQLTGLYANLNIPLPLTTQIVVGISNITISYWPFVLGLIVFLIFAYNRWVSTDSGRLVKDDAVLHIPIFGIIIQLSILTELARTFGLLVGAGTLVVQSLNESADVAGNKVYQNAILDVAKRVEKGITVGDALSTYAIFPPILVQMVRIGEQTGKLDESLLKVSEYFEREVEGKVKGLTTALEPVIMVVLGVAVAFLIISIITPIYNLTSSIQ